MPQIPTLLFFWPGQFLYLGQALDTHVHRHHAVQLIISLTTPFQMHEPGQDWVSYQSLLIDSDQPHECRAVDSEILFLNIDPETQIGRELKRLFLTQSAITALPSALLDPFVNQLKAILETTHEHEVIRTCVNTFLGRLMPGQERQPVDERIQKVLSVLQQPTDQPPKLRQLADVACLSAGRLVHLFKEQVGIPIRQYILWERILNAVQYIAQGYTLTGAAHEAGFADSAHFSRTFSRMFGAMPSAITRTSPAVQVHVWR